MIAGRSALRSSAWPPPESSSRSWTGCRCSGPDGESIGKVRDIVVALRVDANPPRVLGLVVEVPTRRRIFVPMLRVTGVDAGASRSPPGR